MAGPRDAQSGAEGTPRREGSGAAGPGPVAGGRDSRVAAGVRPAGAPGPPPPPPPLFSPSEGEKAEVGCREGAVSARPPARRGLGNNVPLLKTGVGERWGPFLKLQLGERGINHTPVNT